MEDRRASPHGLARTLLEQAPPSRDEGHRRFSPFLSSGAALAWL